MKRGGPLKRRPRAKPSMAASPAQREKVRGRVCIACGNPGNAQGFGRVDPAHLVDRSLGGCDDPDCVVPLCRYCHDKYDEHSLDLSIYLEPDYRVEVAHAVLHLGLWRTVRRVSGRPDPNREAA